MKPYRVAVYPMDWKEKPRFIGYCLDFDMHCHDGCIHDVTARDNNRAKAMAIREHAIRCLRDPKHKAASDALRRATR